MNTLRIPTLADIETAWHGLPEQTRNQIGIIAIDMVFQAFVHGDAYIVCDQLEDLPVYDQGIQEAAGGASDRRLNEINHVVEVALPDLFGKDENPPWSENPGPNPSAAARAWAAAERAAKVVAAETKRQERIELQASVATAIEERWTHLCGPATELAGYPCRPSLCQELAKAALIEIGEVDPDPSDERHASRDGVTP